MEAYVVRVFTPVGVPVEGLHGTAVHLASGRQTAFADVAELVRFLAGAHEPQDPERGRHEWNDN
jgi:hypothetical protein